MCHVCHVSHFNEKSDTPQKNLTPAALIRILTQAEAFP